MCSHAIMKSTKRWMIPPVDPVAASLAAALGLPRPIAQVLVNRGFHDAESVRRFLRPRLQHLSDPFELPQMTAAVDRLLDAIERKQRIVIYGDYDVDGVTSSALLFRVLSAAGANRRQFPPASDGRRLRVEPGRRHTVPGDARAGPAGCRGLRHQFSEGNRRA